ncbi:hypothetical protein [Paenibacillus sp. LHD-38]|nr:hypothetical protein [Paenibacillus sp. LHD-38]MDQ8736608.1 hypothetical protein [Paenibacillus sp. LHD-38]
MNPLCIYISPSSGSNDTSDVYIPEPGTDPMDAIEEAIRQKLDGK